MTTFERIASARSPFDRYLAGEPLPRLHWPTDTCVGCGHPWTSHGTVKGFGGVMACCVFVSKRTGQDGFYRVMCHCTRKIDGG